MQFLCSLEWFRLHKQFRTLKNSQGGNSMFKKGTSLLVVVCIIISTVVTGFGKEIGKETAESGGKSMEEVSFRNAGKLKKPGELIVKYKEKPSFRAMSNVGNGEKDIKIRQKRIGTY